mmetsp:Transcript_54363/g.80638  ORF Transcript_54363/g.80638 Transcript_54363/m.80638 type:complete len:153 (+) Transcript_54363:109-567(+)
MLKNVLLLLASTALCANAFTTSPSFLGSKLTGRTAVSRTNAMSMKVVDIDGEATFDSTIKAAGSNLVIIDYSTTWCGPCKVIAPKFDEFSDKYPDAVFLKVIGDASPDASKLMKREGVRSVPSFHYFKDGEKVEVVNGANADAIEAAIHKHM